MKYVHLGGEFMKKWKTIGKLKTQPRLNRGQNSKLKSDDAIKIILNNRGLRTKKEIEEFLNPKLETVTAKNVGIDEKQLKKAVDRIKKAVKNGEQIIIFGDYDVDGICGTAILWETLHSLGAQVMPYIPHRVDEGYGLSETGIKNLKLKIKNCSLIITVDNGIVANEAVEFARDQGIDVIITDHHVLPSGGSKKLPNAYAIVHTTRLCGAGVAYLLAQEINLFLNKVGPSKKNFLELVALATVADLVPLLGANRTLLKFGLVQLRNSKRAGLLELFDEARIDKEQVGVYEIGHIIAPRLNATGRIEHAMDSLRLLCTKDEKRAKLLAGKLGTTNRERQQLTLETVNHAKSITAKVQPLSRSDLDKKLLFIAHESYQQGVIGLVASKLVEEFYRPAIVVSIGEKYSKASARSVSGFNIIEFIRSASHLLVDAGGHPMAAGFTVETAKLSILKEALEKEAEKQLGGEMLTRTLKIDCEIPLSLVSRELFDAIEQLAPFGMGNPEPTFISRKVVIEDMRLVGGDGKHLKLRLSQQTTVFDAIAFGMGERAGEIHIGNKIDVVYTVNRDTWNGDERLQLKIKDIRPYKSREV